MQLSHLLQDLQLPALRGGAGETWVEGIAFDSRKVAPGFVFVAVSGTQVDGFDFIESAISKGAKVVISSKEWAPAEEQADIIFVRVKDSSRALALLAERWYDQPSQSLQLVGVTGTNGKTTVTTLLHDLFTGLGYRCGLLSTVEVRVGDEKRSTSHTTPDALAISGSLAEMVAAGVTHAFMEVSSHALVQNRTAGLQFAGGVFTNMSHDHLDYHGDFKTYINAKKLFFDQLPATAFALVNIDDKRGEVMLQNCAARKYRYSLRQLADFRARILDNSAQGLHLNINDREVYTQLLGRFNAYNLLAAFGTAVLLEQEPLEVLRVISQLRAANGRLDILRPHGEGPTAIVDYAHTPDALKNVLETLRELLPKGSEDHRLICVIGAGGDRDRSKRPLMARIAVDMADYVILTSDNPRSEDPQAILDEMESGLEGKVNWNVRREADRRKAIQLAVEIATPRSIILVAGKGHETYQEIKGERFPFDDKEVLQQTFNQYQNN